jgi:hypothetical protein
MKKTKTSIADILRQAHALGDVNELAVEFAAMIDELNCANKRNATLCATIDALRAERHWAVYTLSKIAEARPAKHNKSSYQMAREAMIVLGETWEIK